MNYSNDIMNSMDYIEKHIKEDLTAEKIAHQAGYSLFHFCRIFCFCTGKPLMDYVRSRRLSLAKCELLTGRSVTHIAMDYGFETPSGFSKAFKREFGYSPTFYAFRMHGWNTEKVKLEVGGYIMKPVLIKKPAFKVAGYGIQTNISTNYTKDIAAYWDRYDGENMESRLYSQLTPEKHGEVCLCIPSNDDGNVVYLLGVIVQDFDKATSDMITVTVPEAEYMVFTTPPVDTTDSSTYEGGSFADVIKATWKYIFDEWFPSSGYEYDTDKLDFEFYDERCHFKTDTVMDIYVPVKKLNM